jgi:hypothetical protein
VRLLGGEAERSSSTSTPQSRWQRARDSRLMEICGEGVWLCLGGVGVSGGVDKGRSSKGKGPECPGPPLCCLAHAASPNRLGLTPQPPQQVTLHQPHTPAAAAQTQTAPAHRSSPTPPPKAACSWATASLAWLRAHQGEGRGGE